jgi:hypothetical protein
VPQAELDVLHLTPAVGHGDEVLGPSLRPFDGPPEPASHCHGDDMFRRRPDLPAEGAADVRSHDSQPRRVEAEQLGRLVAPGVRHLSGDVDGQVVALLSVAGDDGDGVAL